MTAAAGARRAALLVVCLATASGCSDFSTVYGPTTGHDGRRSVNGFGALRQTFENAGADSHDVHRLSRRTARNDVIVWIPTHLHSVPARVGNWFDRWLRRGKRTLIYIVPDSGSETEYWHRAAPLAPPDRRLEYRRRAARSIGRALSERLSRQPVGVHDWFRVQPLEHVAPAAPLGGPWIDQQRIAPGDPESSRAISLGEPAKDAIAASFEITGANGAEGDGSGATSGTGTRGGRGRPQSPAPPPGQSAKTSGATYELAPLISGRGGEWIVGEVTSERWRDSKIIVVSGGSLLTNFAFARPWNRNLASQLATSSIGRESFHAGFLTSSGSNIPVSEARPGAPQATGMELLTVWPLSLVTVHGVILGIVVCLMLLPIFGRPRRVRRGAPSRFGDHLDAVAALMNKAGGEPYARSRISQYLRRVRGETSGPWILPEPEHAAESEPSDRPDQPARQSVE